MNRLLNSLLTALFAFCLFVPLQSHAEVGQWTVHAVFASPAEKVIDTGTKIYYLSGGSLFSYDKKEQESRSYTMNSGLNSPTISGIYYNPLKHYLLIAHTSGNIDLLYDDGRIVNMSDISDSTIDPPLTINDVWFNDSSIYVATSFGLVEFNDERHEVVQSGIYNAAVTAVTVSDGHLLICSDGKVRSLELGKRFTSLSNFAALYDSEPLACLIPVGDGRYLTTTSVYNCNVMMDQIDLASQSRKERRVLGTHSSSFSLSQSNDGRFYYASDGSLYALNPETLVESVVCKLPEQFNGCIAGSLTGASEIWTLTRDGLACHNFSGDQPLQLTERFRPEEFSVKMVCHFFPSADGKRLYVTNHGSTVYRYHGEMWNAYSYPLTAACIDLTSDEFTDVTPYPVEAHLPFAIENQRNVGQYIMSPTSLAPDPDNASTFFVSSSVDGVYKMTDGKLEGRFDETNSPLYVFDSRNIAYHVDIDQGGNLWVNRFSSEEEGSPIHVLPAAKRKLNPSDIKKSDWITLPTKSVNYTGGQDIEVLHAKKSNITIVADHNSNYNFLAYDDRGTRDNFSDDKIKLWTRIIDQDGNTFAPAYFSALCEDRDGSIWIGTSGGVIVISNPASAVTDNMTVRRVKVPKNDGTNSAEYLLSTDLIYSISTDAANRKWIATAASGLFLVSADGSEIIENFTTDNSPLASNTVYSVYASPWSNTIYVGTPEGLLSYESNATPAMESFDNITVFPNPVTPDYTGPIYVKGLMDGSLVKITDSAGHLLYQGRSEGGLFSWDGINSAGSSLPSGIYYVFASQSSDGSSAGGTAKFMIIR